MKSLALSFSTLLCALFSFLQASEGEMKEILVNANLNGFAVSGTDKESEHSYLKPYAELLERYRDKLVDLLEIGVYFGGSAYLWHEYLPRSQLLLVDIYKAMHPGIEVRLDPARYQYISSDAYQLSTVHSIAAERPAGFDIIIDDGPHSLDSQIFAINHYSPLLKSGGILVVEDVANDHNLQTLKSIASFLRLSYKVYDLRNVKGRSDDILFVIYK